MDIRHHFPIFLESGFLTQPSLAKLRSSNWQREEEKEYCTAVLIVVFEKRSENSVLEDHPLVHRPSYVSASDSKELKDP